MKKILLILVLITGSICFKATAQVHVNVNIGVQPVWGPVGYDQADYYYMPDIDAYYNVPQRQFIYLEGGSWIFAANLPYRYHNYDLYRGYKVVMNEPRPWLHNEVYRQRYYQYRGNRNQPMIRDSRDERYWEIREHPQHGNWHQNEGHDNYDNGYHHGNGNGHDNGHGHGNREGHHD